MAGCAYRMVNALPPGDNLPFEEAGGADPFGGDASAEDVELLLAVIKAGHRGQTSAIMPMIVETFHHGCRDAIETIEASGDAQTVLHWLESLSMQFANLDGTVTSPTGTLRRIPTRFPPTHRRASLSLAVRPRSNPSAVPVGCRSICRKTHTLATMTLPCCLLVTAIMPLML